MATNPITWLVGTSSTLVSSTTNLANNALLAGASYSNTLNYLMAEIEMLFSGTTGFTGAVVANTGMNVWFLSALAGGNFEDGSATVTPVRPPDVVLPFQAASTSDQHVIKRCSIPPGTFVPLIQNTAGVATSSGAGATVAINILPITFAY